MATLKPPNRLENVAFYLEKDPDYLHNILKNYDPIISKIIFKSTAIDPKKRATSEQLMKILLKDKENSKFLDSQTDIRILCDNKGIIININDKADVELGIKKFIGHSVNLLTPKEYSLYKNSYISELTEITDLVIQKSDGKTLPFRVIPLREDLLRIIMTEIPYNNELNLDDQILKNEFKKIDQIYDDFLVNSTPSFEKMGDRLYEFKKLNQTYEDCLKQWNELKNKSEYLKYSIEIEKLRITLTNHKHYHEFLKFLGNDYESIYLCKFYHEVENYKKIPTSSHMKKIYQHYFVKKRIPLIAPIIPKIATFEVFDVSQIECLNLLRFQYLKFEKIKPEYSPSDYEKSEGIRTEISDRTSTDYTDFTGDDLNSSEEDSQIDRLSI